MTPSIAPTNSETEGALLIPLSLLVRQRDEEVPPSLRLVVALAKAAETAGSYSCSYLRRGSSFFRTGEGYRYVPGSPRTRARTRYDARQTEAQTGARVKARCRDINAVAVTLSGPACLESERLVVVRGAAKGRVVSRASTFSAPTVPVPYARRPNSNLHSRASSAAGLGFAPVLPSIRIPVSTPA